MKKHVLLFFGLIFFSFIFSNNSFAQNICRIDVPCQVDGDCQNFLASAIPPGGCPVCIGCVNGLCAPKDALCDDGNDCTTDTCFFDDGINGGGTIPITPNGCQYTTIVVDFPPPDDLPIACYICEPTANGVLVDNGICETEAGENCSNSPDCNEEGVPCGTPPVPSAPDCDIDPAISALAPCQDGDRCTEDVCVPGANVATCENPPKACLPDSDGCCPVGCDGPDPATAQPGGTPCHDPTGAPIPNCDADCCFPQVCGDALVQPPETCDDNANLGDAGISPQGAIVTDTQCRDVGTPGECTYCGDGLIQAVAGEECEFNNDTACGTAGCDLTTCQCNQNLCVTGSGNIFNEIRPDCANCSFHPEATSQGWFHDYQALFFLAGIAGVGLVLRRRNS